MSFGENLQFLRKQQGLTQEELAEKMNVSRQTISKWESDGVFPEMDKVLNLCTLFDVNMDVLLRGNIEEASADDIKEYDREMNRFTWQIVLATALILVGISGLLLLAGIGFEDSVLILIPFFACLIVAVAIYIVSGINHDYFVKEHPFIKGRYEQQEITAFKRRFPVLIAVPVTLILLDILVLCLLSSWFEGPRGDSNAELFMAIFLLVIALAVSILIYAGMQEEKYNIEGYNRKNNITDDTPEAKNERLAGKISGCIMLTATAIFLLVGFIWDLWHPGWVVFPIGGILCAIVSTILDRK